MGVNAAVEHASVVTALVLFDIDGTLVAPNGAGRAALLATGTQLFGESFTVEGLDPSGKLDPAIFEELAARHPHVDLRGRSGEFQRHYLAAMRSQTHRMRALPGASAALTRLAREPGVVLGILTGNLPAVATLKLVATGLTPAGAADPFAVRVHGDEAAQRADLVPLALQRLHQRRGEVRPIRPVVVGDTPRDVEAAHAHGAPVLAVATGRWSSDALQAAGADRVAPDLVDLTPLLELIALVRSTETVPPQADAGPPGASGG